VFRVGLPLPVKLGTSAFAVGTSRQSLPALRPSKNCSVASLP
jgi:hypothetical protein